LLLHVVDAADPHRDERIAQVEAVLAEIDAAEIPCIEVWNKIDKLPDTQPRSDRFDGDRRARVWVSAARGQGFDLLRAAIDRELGRERVHAWVRLPLSAGRLRARLFAAGAVSTERLEDDAWALEIDAARNVMERMYGLPDGDGAWLRQALGG
jgi:GTP-binding protein HflX